MMADFKFDGKSNKNRNPKNNIAYNHEQLKY